MTRLRPYLLGIPLGLLSISAQAQSASPYQSSEDFAKYAMKLRENALNAIEPRVSTPTTARTSLGAYKWRTGIITTIFWCGESASMNNPVHNRSSSWDLNWSYNFGGFDNPDPGARVAGPSDYRAKDFLPKQNPFYFALPYNDVTRGTTKPESKTWIPWFKRTFVREGLSVCRDRWIAVRNPRNGRTAYGQWSDCGPFRTDHHEYVFGDKRPLPNLNGGAGLDVSPSMRDFLGLANTDVTDWRFVEVREVPPGPWRKYGDNNPFVTSGLGTSVVRNQPATTKKSVIIEAEPKVQVR
jgi:hypothetical protein